jgi:hypothetical protein
MYTYFLLYNVGCPDSELTSETNNFNIGRSPWTAVVPVVRSLPPPNTVTQFRTSLQIAVAVLDARMSEDDLVGFVWAVKR